MPLLIQDKSAIQLNVYAPGLYALQPRTHYDLMDYNTIITDDTAHISNLLDISIYQNHATQTVISNRPQYAMVQNFPCALFNVNESSRFLNLDTSFLANKTYEIFAVAARFANYAHVHGYNTRTAGSGFGFGWSPTSAERFVHYHWNYDLSVPCSSTLQEMTLIHLGLNSSGKFVKLNGYPAVTNGQSAPLPRNDISYLGKAVGTQTVYGKMALFEYVIFDRLLNSVDSLLTEIYLAKKWNLKNTFSPQHEYYPLLAA